MFPHSEKGTFTKEMKTQGKQTAHLASQQNVILNVVSPNNKSWL